MDKIKNRKARILFIMSFPPPFHGANLSNQMVWESEVQDRFDCQLLDISDRRDLNNLGRFEFINVYLGIKQLFQITAKLFLMRPDIVYLLISQNKWAVVRDCVFILLIKMFSSAKVAVHLRGAFFKPFYDQTSSLVKLLVDFTFKKVAAFIVLGANLKFNFEKWSDRIYVVPNGTDLLMDFTIDQKIILKAKNEIVITFLSNFFKSKGILEVIGSIKEVVNRSPDKKITYKIAGEWGLDPILGLSAEEIKKAAYTILEKDKTESYVEFLGVVTGDAKLNLLKQTDIFLLPTSYDGHPRAIIEAMAAGCPVISTPIGAIPDTVMDNETGFIIPPYNLQMLIEKIVKLIEDENLRMELSSGARKRYETLFTKDKFINNVIQTFYSISAQ